jgi:polyisoprenoid-binding protein YceI
LRRFPVLLTSFLLAAAFVACANPADNVPSAEVNEPQAAPEAATGEIYEIAEGSTVGFIGSKITGSHDGGFHGFEGRITLLDGDPSKSSIELLIDTTSLWADNDNLAEHLKSLDFFDVEAHPTATFTSTGIKPAGDMFEVTGNLDLHGVVKSISFPAQITTEESSVTAKAEFSIKRFDFDIVYPGKPDDLIRDEVVIKFDLVGAREAGPEQGA